MHVTVNACLVKSRWPIYLIVAFYALTTGLLAIGSIPPLLCGVWLSAMPALLWWAWGNQYTGQLRWQGSQLSLAVNESIQDWHWSGAGRLSSQFIVWYVKNDQKKHHFLVWRGQLDDASWRACQMAFKVWRGRSLEI